MPVEKEIQSARPAIPNCKAQCKTLWTRIPDSTVDPPDRKNMITFDVFLLAVLDHTCEGRVTVERNGRRRRLNGRDPAVSVRARSLLTCVIEAVMGKKDLVFHLGDGNGDLIINDCKVDETALKYNAKCATGLPP